MFKKWIGRKRKLLSLFISQRGCPNLILIVELIGKFNKVPHVSEGFNRVDSHVRKIRNQIPTTLFFL